VALNVLLSVIFFLNSASSLAFYILLLTLSKPLTDGRSSPLS
jgi:hypothetical protein